MSISALLETEIMDEFEALRKEEFGSEKYKVGVDGITKLLDRSIEIDKFENEADKESENREYDNKLKEQQISDDRKHRWVQSGITAAGIVLPLIVTIWGTKASLNFEKEGTVTTIMGRGFINKLLPKKWEQIWTKS